MIFHIEYFAKYSLLWNALSQHNKSFHLIINYKITLNFGDQVFKNNFKGQH